MSAADVFLETAGRCLEAGALLALLAHDEDAACELASRLTPAEAHLLEPAAEKLAELAYRCEARGLPSSGGR